MHRPFCRRWPFAPKFRLLVAGRRKGGSAVVVGRHQSQELHIFPLHILSSISFSFIKYFPPFFEIQITCSREEEVVQLEGIKAKNFTFRNIALALPHERDDISKRTISPPCPPHPCYARKKIFFSPRRSSLRMYTHCWTPLVLIHHFHQYIKYFLSGWGWRGGHWSGWSA